MKGKKLLALAMAFALAGSSALMAPMTVKAADGDSTGNNAIIEDEGSLNEGGDIMEDGETRLEYLDDTGNSPIEMGVYVNAENGADMVFSVSVSWGQMQFRYIYGSVWNPQTHTYDKAGTTGWDLDYMSSDADPKDNNCVKIYNNSNYPVYANLSYTNTDDTVFNNATELDTSVVALFSVDDQALYDAETGSNGKTMITGYGTRNANSGIATTLTVALDSDTTNLADGDKYYSLDNVDSDNTADSGHDWETYCYFGFFGRPDSTVTIGEGEKFEQVGTINMSVAPIGKNDTSNPVHVGTASR